MEGVEGVVGDYHVIHEGEVEAVAGFAEFSGVDDVGAAGFWISGRMVVHYRNGEGAAVERTLHNASHIEGGRISGA